jgi:hypothetical protein
MPLEEAGVITHLAGNKEEKGMTEKSGINSE